MHLWRRPFTVLWRKLSEFQPDLVGLSALTFEAEEMHRAAELVKRFRPQCPVVVGGPHGTMFYPEVLEDGNVDYVVVGEGEKTLVELADHLAEGGHFPELKGVAFRRDGEVRFSGMREPITDPDTIPFPAWDLVKFDRYRRFADVNLDMAGGLGRGRYMGLFTSRSCPYQCVYCHSIFGKGFRARSPGSIEEEIGVLTSRYGVKEFQIYDDCFNLDRNRTLAIAQGIVRRDFDIRISFPNGVRGDLLDEEVLTWLKRAGGYYLCIAVETASPRLQKIIKKNLDLAKVGEAIRIADRVGFLVKGYFMLGFPGETEEEMRRTIDFAVNSPLFSAAFFTVVPFSKTPIYDMYRKPPKPSRPDFIHHHYYFFRGRDPFTEEGINLRKMQRQAYIQFHLRKPWRIIKGFTRAPNPLGYAYMYLFRGVKVLGFH